MRSKRRKTRNQDELTNYKLTAFVNEKTYSPIETNNVKKIADAAIKILAEIGISDAPKEFFLSLINLTAFSNFFI